MSVFVLFFCGTGFFCAAAVLSDCADNEIPEGVKLPIIMYHSTYRKNPNKYNVPPSLFRRDMEYLLKRGYTPITVQDLIDFYDGASLPKNPVMITLDDGYANNYHYVFPILKELNIKCVMAVVGAYTADASQKKEGNAHMDYAQIKELAESGYVEIQNHTYSLHDLKAKRRGLSRLKGESEKEYCAAICADLTRLNEKLLEKTGVNCTAVAYPFGCYDKQWTAKAMRAAGFFAGFTCNEKLNYITRESDFYMLRRFNRPYGPSTEDFFGRVFGDAIKK